MEAVIIKKYANRRLYHTGEKSYVTLDQVAQLIRDGSSVQIVDNQTKKDITQETLLQIILSNNKKSNSLFSIPLLHQMIRVQEEHMQEFLKFYLSSGLEYFNKFSQNINNQFSGWNQLWGNMFPHMPGAKQIAPSNEMIQQFQSHLMQYEEKIRELEKNYQKRRRFHEAVGTYEFAFLIHYFYLVNGSI